MGNKLGLGDILASINNESDLSGSNVVKKIQDKLKEKSKVAYQNWKEDQFDINHLFTVQSGYPDRGKNKVTLLYIATAICSTNLVKALLEVEGIDVDYGAKSYLDKFTPLQLAAMKGYKEIAELLMRKGANVNLGYGNNPLCLAVKNAHIELVRLLIKEETHINKRDISTLLEEAPTEKRTEVADCIVKSFLDREKGTDIIDSQRNNLLHYAADSCSEEVILTLIGKNVDPWLKNRNGKTPVEIYTSKYPNGSGYLKKLKKATTRSNIAFYLMVTLGATVVISTFVIDMKVPGIIAATIVAPEVLYVIGAAVLVFAFIVRYITYRVCEPSAKIDDTKEVQALSITNTEEENKEKSANPVKLTHENRFFIMEKKKDLPDNRYEQEVKDLIKLVDQDEKITLSSIVIKDELKKELKAICNNVSEKMQEKMKKLRYKPPAGYIFYGPPGTGKTLLARAIAGETDRSFISISGSELVGKYVGHGVSHVRDLFKKAKQNAPCVIFIDEIDAIGGERSSDNNSASRDQNQTLNQLLTEMDGFKNNKDIVVIAATNRIETLDSALLRAGRFSKKIHIPLPDEGLRKEILKFYIKDLPTEELNLKDLADKTKGFSGADISHLVNEVKLHVIYRTEEANEDDIKLTMSDFTTVLKRLRSEFRKSENNQASSEMDIRTLLHGLVNVLNPLQGSFMRQH
ncbi:AAA family ATPase [Wolbachia endosymbiont of Ctenocephalides felis wCfeJ]|uniref:AAA family ATPase n=1 Tax=Wolbachia endosymbiont of Ctenocephalides felis wCfeJ TaxID=2732594 RepID=UPI001447F2C9|nr:AAA family ATPase [Wolbachia endosymbiont of Ctenocephalides felis wCfeJ]WCR58373.1 MAG: ATP-dependent zinc metalloprotease FtsH [Wolbachia endosymbiont of Ctenocephalides felis wCfeJ]